MARTSGCFFALVLLAWCCVCWDACHAYDVTTIETFTKNDAIYAKVRNIQGHVRHMRLSLSGGASVCDFDTASASLLDTSGFLIRPIMQVDHNAAARDACFLDLKFMFVQFRHVIFMHNSIVFTTEPLHATAGSSCEYDNFADVSASLCEMHAQDLVLRWFGTGTNFYENAGFVNLDIGGHVAHIEPAPWSSRSQEQTVAIPAANLLKEYDIHYDIIHHRISLDKRTPSIFVKNTCGSLGVFNVFFFVTRLMIDDLDVRLRWLHYIMIATAAVSIGIAVTSESNAFGHSSAFTIIVSVASVVHLVLEIMRLADHARTRGNTNINTSTNSSRTNDTTSLQTVTLRPDMALILTAVIVCFYATVSHSMVIIPALMAIVYTTKTIAEALTIPFFVSSDSARTWVNYLISFIADVLLVTGWWRYIIGDFLTSTVTAKWYLQEVFMSYLVVIAGMLVANMRMVSKLQNLGIEEEVIEEE